MTNRPTLKRCDATMDVWNSVWPNLAFHRFRSFSWKGETSEEAKDSRRRNLVNIYGNLERALDDPIFSGDERPRIATLVDPKSLEVVEYVSLLKLVRLWPKWSRHSTNPPKHNRRIDCVAVYRSLKGQGPDFRQRVFVLKQTLDLKRDSTATRVRRRGTADSSILVPGIYCQVPKVDATDRTSAVSLPAR
jgi:hypothetical protein